MLDVAILGTGVAAACVCRACRDHGIKPTIISATPPDMAPYGAFWFHDVPDSMKHLVKPQHIRIFATGTAARYSTMMWGAEWPVSWGEYAGKVVLGYDPFEVIPLLWAQELWETGPGGEHWWRQRIFQSDREIVQTAEEFDITFMTFPTYEAKRAQPKLAPFHILVDPVVGQRDNVVWYVGLSEEERGTPGLDYLLRESVLWGFVHREYAMLTMEMRRAMEQGTFGQTAHVTAFKLHPSTQPWHKPPENNKKIVLMGRYATWRRKLLAHEVYQETSVILSSISGNSNEATTNG